ncbi:MAG: adenylate kinase [Chloroflexi bacterium]|nr:MAG: adenylate kinase [Chloroflexota bacterium]TME45879.1 MAG: adenylate kinase [Chloroflexota bacterium]
MGVDLVLLGPPGSGKGTQAARLSAALSIPHIATGDIFRALVEAGTPLGQRVKAFLERGELVPDDLVIDVIRHRLGQADATHGFVLDGFPRTVPQAEALDRLLVELGRPLDAVVYLQADRQSLIERLGQRAEVEGRSDDRPDVILHRIDVFLEQTAPLIDYYRRNSKLRLVDGTRLPDAVAASIREVIDSLPRDAV